MGYPLYNYEYIIEANEFGIETYFEQGEFDLAYCISRGGGIASGSLAHRRFDTGSWSILDAMGTKIRGEDDMPLDFDEEVVLDEFDKTASSIIKDYPQTAKWYHDTRKELVEEIAREKSPIRRANSKIEALKREIRDYKVHNENLTQGIRKEAAKLKINLELLEAVKNSFLGEVFFKEVLQKYESFRNTRLKPEKTRRFYRKTNSSPKSQGLKNDATVNLSDKEKQELEQLRIKIKKLERKARFLKITYKELNQRNGSLAEKEYFTRQVINDFKESSSFKKAFLRREVEKYKQHEAELYR